ncbi:MAG: hypothetical protein V3W34_20530 [Phycisphaerae bacterium]
MTRYALLTFLVAGAPGFAQVVSYEGTAFPEDTGDGWIQLETLFPADRWLEHGWLVQALVVLPCPPECTTRDFYRRQLEDQAGDAVWFLEWVMVTDGPQAFGAVAPASIVAAGHSGVLYHFTIAVDRIAFKRGSQFPLVFADLEPGPHVFRLELHNTPPSRTYIFTIDGELIDAGVAEGPYPVNSSFIVFGASAAIEDSITRWNYVRFGRPGQAGDWDSDGDLDLDDFYFFHECLADRGNGPNVPTDPGCLWADMDGDGDVDFHDFSLFQLAFTGSG